ncbi:MAG: CD36 family protein [Candidatus Thalassarchaeum sp.]|nr:CD36 family protein [Candidatus Thalassarchaeum sp.]
MDNQQKASTILTVGILLIGINFLALAPFVAGQVEAGVQDVVADGYDGYDDDGNENYTADYDDEWLVSTSERVYFAYSLDNPDEVDAGEAHEFTKMGPFIYEVTTTREILDFNYDAGEITYSEYDSFEWCETCTWIDDNGDSHNSVPGSTEITQVNILWNTQRIAGISTGIVYGEVFAKAGFANNMIATDLQNRAPSIWASEDISGMVDTFSLSLQATGMDEVNASILAPSGVLSGAYVSATGGGTTSDILNNTQTFFPYADSILYGAQDPSTGICIALTCDIGPMLVAGMGAPDGGVVTQTRAALYGYADAGDDMAAIDLAVYALAGNTFLAHGGGADLTQVTDLRQRLNEVSGVDITNPDVLNGVIFGTPDAEIPNGLLSVSDYSGIPLNGIALFLLGAQGDLFGTMTTYGIGLTQLLGLSDYAGEWIGMVGTPTEFEMILAGGQGTMSADDWWQISFGSEEPIAGGYIPIGLNRAEFQGTIDMDVAKVTEILYTSPYALTSDFASIFMYGELSGSTLPAEEGAETTDWNDAYVAGLYDISESDAAAVRSWVADFMFDQVIGALLGFQYGGSAYITQPVDNWLFGWRDIIVADVVYGEPDNMALGWVSLETNETYFGSDSVTTGDYDVYVASTEGDNMGQRLLQGYINSDGNGHCDFKLNSDGTMADADSSGMYPCEEGELYGFTEHLPWRAPHRETSTLGLLSAHVGNENTVVAGAVGGVADSDDPFRVNLVGYAMAESVPGDMETYKGIEMRAHTVNLDPSQNQIQAKLIGSASFVDVLPGALPVYFGSTVDIKVEPVTQVAMYGKSVSMFHLDLRGPGMLNPEMGVDTHPVFEIHTFSEIADEDAETFQCRVLDNMEPMYWTDFGGSGDCELEGTAVIDSVTAVLYVASIAMIAVGALAFGGMGPIAVSKDED